LKSSRRALLVQAAALTWAAALPARAQSPEPIRLALIEGLSGPFGNAGEGVFRNLLMAVERVNRRGGVRIGAVRRPLQLLRFDSKGTVEEALASLNAALDQRVGFVFQGNGSAVAAALSDALDKHNARVPERRALLLNYSAIDPTLTNERCSFWHFRFDAHADMRLAALLETLQADRELQQLYLLNQDYSLGQHVARQARAQLAQRRPDVRIVGDELHPLGRVRDFTPYATKIKASGAQALLTVNWGNDLTLLVRALRDVGADIRLYTFYGNALGAPSAIGEAGVGRVFAVAEWFPNAGGVPSDAFYASFRQRFTAPQDDWAVLRQQLAVEMLVAALERAGSDEAAAVARALEGATSAGTSFEGWHDVRMRAEDHQLLQPLRVAVMDRAGSPGVVHDVEGSGYGFRVVRRIDPAAATLPHSCRMARSD
jgi:branched-chain amino acid transport system substrate-binding protein